VSQALTLARPYARAAFAEAQQTGVIVAWSDALTFSARVAADPQVAGMLGDPRLTADAAVALLSPDGAPADYSRFLNLLAANHRLPLLPEIAGMYAELRAEAERVVKATVTSATMLPDAELATIKTALRKRFGRDVDVATAVDPALIGGAVITAGDVVIDGSLRGKLERLQSALAA
jgi:F-type H+-transporting ATPase subunit delta